MCLTRACDDQLPHLVEQLIGWRYRPELGDDGELVFSNDLVDDPFNYFGYLPVEQTTDARPFVDEESKFKNDPYLRLRFQRADTSTEYYATRAEVLHAANRRLWAAWENASANILGCFTVGESPSGLYVGSPWVLWPAAALPGLSDVSQWAEFIAHLWAHIGDQALRTKDV